VRGGWRSVTSHLFEKRPQHPERPFHPVAANTVAGAFDVDELPLCQQRSDFLVLLPISALGIRFENECRGSDLGEQFAHRRPFAGTHCYGVRVMEPL